MKNRHLDHIMNQTPRDKLACWAVAIVGLTLWVTAIVTLLELGSNN